MFKSLRQFSPVANNNTAIRMKARAVNHYFTKANNSSVSYFTKAENSQITSDKNDPTVTITKKQYLKLENEINNLSILVSIYSCSNLTIATIFFFKIL